MRIVIALGGNALGIEPQEQKKNAQITAKLLLPIIEAGHEVIITHGNGPQVGLINLAFTEGRKVNDKVYEMGFSECGAMSQGYIGYHLCNALTNEAIKNKSSKKFATLVTHILVDKNDPAFLNPTKPIGGFYTYEESLKMPYPMKEDSGRGYRRVIASPKPVDIIEQDEIDSLISNGYTVICCGGGGIPVVKENGLYQGIDAVIDKDFASSKLASKINADMLVILTAVKNACINFNTPNQVSLGKITTKEIKKYLDNNEFKAGSMKPKVEACLEFVTNKNRKAVITDIESASEAINGTVGTIIEY